MYNLTLFHTNSAKLSSLIYPSVDLVPDFMGSKQKTCLKGTYKTRLDDAFVVLAFPRFFPLSSQKAQQKPQVWEWGDEVIDTETAGEIQNLIDKYYHQ